MQSPRTLGIIALLLLAVGAAALWLFSRDHTTLTPLTTTDATSPRDGTRDPAEAATGDTPEGTTNPAGAEASEATATIDRTAAATITPDAPGIVGRVVDGAGQPLAGVEVVCAPGMAFSFDFGAVDLQDRELFDGSLVNAASSNERNFARAATDADGRFRVVPTGTQRLISVRLLHRGYQTLDRTLPRPDKEDADLETLTLARGGIIAGRVVDPRGNPIDGAVVSVVAGFEAEVLGEFDFGAIEGPMTQRFGQTSRTGADGRFELAHVEAGDVSLRAKHEDHPTARKGKLGLAVGQELRDVLIELPLGATIRGRVTDLPDERSRLVVMAASKPKAEASDPAMGVFGGTTEFIADMGLPFGERECAIAADGTFELRGLRAERTYRLWLAQKRPASAQGFPAAAGSCSERVEADAGRVDVLLRYDPGVTVTLTLVDAATGRPVEDVLVNQKLRGGGGMMDFMAMAGGTDQKRHCPEGRLLVEDLRPKPKQKLDLTIQALGYTEWSRKEIELPAAGNLDLGKVELSSQPVLHVTVLDDRSGAPISGAKVAIGGAGGGGDNPFARLAARRGQGLASATTDAEGRCSINLPASGGELTVTHREHADFAQALPAPTQPDNEATARMLVGGDVTVTVVDEAGQLSTGTSVEHRAPDGTRQRRKTDQQGAVRFKHLIPGAHAFRIAGEESQIEAAIRVRIDEATSGKDDTQAADASWQTADVANAAAVELTLTRATAAIVQGQVRENGLPLAGARITFLRGPGKEDESPEAAAMGMVGDMFEQFGNNSDQRGRSGDDGSYRIADLPPGRHRLQVKHKERAMPSVFPVELREGENLYDLDLEMTSVAGVVLDPDGNPVAGAKVRVSVAPKDSATAIGNDLASSIAGSIMPGMGGTAAESDASGMFVLRGITPDVNLRLQASGKGFSPTATTVTVARGDQRSDVQLRLGKAGRIQVEVANAPPMAVAVATFVGDLNEGAAPVMQMLRKGKGTLDGLCPGTWRVRLQRVNLDNPDGGDADERDVEVRAGETTTVNF